MRASKLDVYLRLVAVITPEPDAPPSATLASLSDEDLTTTIALINEWKEAQGQGG